MFNQEKFCYKKCFANNNNDSKKSEIQYSVQLNVRVLMVKKSLGFTFSDV